jgi:hypothetical protein
MTFFNALSNHFCAFDTVTNGTVLMLSLKRELHKHNENEEDCKKQLHGACRKQAMW